jgi:hypothetical protein
LSEALGAYREAPYVATRISTDANRCPEHDAMPKTTNYGSC